MYTKFFSLHHIFLVFLVNIFAGCAAQNENSMDIDNAKTRVNWVGTYQGVLSCGNGCEGIATMLVLYPDQHYVLRTRRLDQEIKDRITEGKFDWKEDNKRITLNTKNGPLTGIMNTMQVGKDKLMMVTPQGKLPPKNQRQAFELNKTGALPKPSPTI